MMFYVIKMSLNERAVRVLLGLCIIQQVILNLVRIFWMADAVKAAELSRLLKTYMLLVNLNVPVSLADID
nr:hypothetical protein [Cronobacter turicensis]